MSFSVMVQFAVPHGADARALAAGLAAEIEASFGPRPAFLSATVHASLDGRRIVNHAHWRSRRDWEHETGVDGSDPTPTRQGTWLARAGEEEPVARYLLDAGLILDRVDGYEEVATVVGSSDTTDEVGGRPALHREDPDARAAVDSLVEDLQQGLDGWDADRYDARFAADVLWGTPKGAVVDELATLLPIHRSQMAAHTAPASRFELVTWRCPRPGVAVAQIRRRSLDPAAFSEVAVYTLVERDGRWWLAAAQNTPVVATLRTRRRESDPDGGWWPGRRRDGI